MRTFHKKHSTYVSQQHRYIFLSSLSSLFVNRPLHQTHMHKPVSLFPKQSNIPAFMQCVSGLNWKWSTEDVTCGDGKRYLRERGRKKGGRTWIVKLYKNNREMQRKIERFNKCQICVFHIQTDDYLAINFVTFARLVFCCCRNCCLFDFTNLLLLHLLLMLVFSQTFCDPAIDVITITQPPNPGYNITIYNISPVLNIWLRQYINMLAIVNIVYIYTHTLTFCITPLFSPIKL